MASILAVQVKSGEKVVIISISGMTMIVAKPDDVIIGQDH